MKGIGEHWNDFATHVIPPRASHGQRTDLQMAFYAGAFALTTIIASCKTDAELEAALHSLIAELAEMKDQIFNRADLKMACPICGANCQCRKRGANGMCCSCHKHKPKKTLTYLLSINRAALNTEGQRSLDQHIQWAGARSL